MISGPVRDAFDAGGRGLQHQGLRRANERAVLAVVGFNAGVSNADIARLSGLAPQTVSAILTDLDAAGLIVRGQVLRGRRGQPATPIFLNATGAFAVGIEIGWNHVDVLLLNMHAQVLARRHASHAFPDPATIVDTLSATIDEVLRDLPPGQRERLLDIGVGLPDALTTRLELSPAQREQVELWRHFNLVSELGARTGIEVSLFNSGNAGCWAEFIAATPRPANFIYFLVGRDVGAGIVNESLLLAGKSGNSANLGSMLVSDCGGQLTPASAIASVTALGRRLAASGCMVENQDPAEWDWAGHEAAFEAWLGECARALAIVVLNTSMVIEGQVVVIDTALRPDVAAQLVERLKAELARLPIADHAMPEVQTGALGALAPAVGAAELALYRRYFSRTLADLAS